MRLLYPALPSICKPASVGAHYVKASNRKLVRAVRLCLQLAGSLSSLGHAAHDAHNSSSNLQFAPFSEMLLSNGVGQAS